MAKYILPSFNYGYGDLTPYISEEQLRLHHTKHHQAYVDGANALLEKLARARSENSEIDLKAFSKEFSFNSAGHFLHSLFWNNMAPVSQGGGRDPEGEIAEIIKNEFGSVEQFKKEFSALALKTEGSGWVALAQEPFSGKIFNIQIEKHNVNLIPGINILLVLDVWEHAYYLDYKNERGKFIENFWKIVNWEEVSKRGKFQ